jgi:hypothetical protein
MSVLSHPSRRAVLRGAGAVVLLPFLEGLSRGADSVVRPPRRLGIFTVTGGTVLESWKPKTPGPLDRLPSILGPLQANREDLLILSGLANTGQSENLNGHEHCALLHLTGAPFARKENGRLYSGVSVDQAAAQVVGDQTYLPSLEMGLQSHETKYSFRAPDAPVPYEANPRLVFERMFRGRTPTVPNWQRRAALAAETVRATARADSAERSVVDLVREEANDLRRTLGNADQRRLDEYLHAVRAVEKRVAFVENRQRLEAMEALNPGPSKLTLPTNLPAAGLPIWKITQPVHQDPERHAEYLRLMADLMVLAFQTDTTRVVTLAAGSDEAMFPGVVTVGYERHCHTLEHQGNAGRVEDADPIAREALRQIHAFYTTVFAEMVQKLKNIDEGGSSLLDNCLLLYTSYMADGGHGTRDYPVLLAGKAGGSLKTGRHLAYKPETPLANLYVEILERMGAPVKQFGDSQTSKHAGYEGRLPGLS